MHKIAFIALTALAMLAGAAPAGAQFRYETMRPIAPPGDDPQRPDSIYTVVGIPGREIEQLLPLPPDDKQALDRRIDTFRHSALRRLAVELEGDEAELIANYAENAAEFGPDLGMLTLSERQKIALRKHIAAYREQTRGERSRWTRQGRMAQTRFTLKAYEELDPDQRKRLERILIARGVNERMMPVPVGDAAARPGGAGRPRVEREETIRIGFESIDRVDLEARTVTGVQWRRSFRVYIKKETPIVVDGRLATTEALKPLRPVAILYDSVADDREVAVVQAERPLQAIYGTLARREGEVLHLETSPIESVTLGADTPVVRGELPIEAKDLEPGVTLGMVGEVVDGAFTPHVVADLGKPGANRRWTRAEFIGAVHRMAGPRSRFSQILLMTDVPARTATVGIPEGTPMNAFGLGFERNEVVELEDLKRLEGKAARLSLTARPAEGDAPPEAIRGSLSPVR